MNTFEKFFNIIEKEEQIIIIGHKYPDGDCYGSSQGLKTLIKDFYPNKKVLVSNTDYLKTPVDFPRADVVSDEDFKNSLVIFTDLPDKARASDPRGFELENHGIIKIDHHIFKEEFGDLEIIDDKASSASELVAQIFYSKYQHISQMAASLLFLGFTTDTNRFLYSNFTSSYSLAVRLVEDGARTKEIYENLYVVNEKSLKFNGYIYSNYQKTRLGVAYLTIPYEVSKSFGYDPHGSALLVNTIGRIQASKLWVIIAETSDGKAFCEFRSLGNVNVQKIAVKFTGGGHLNASGCTLDKFSRAQEVIDECEKALVETEFFPFDSELNVMLDLAEQASEIILDYYDKGFKVEIKDDNSPVTSADKASNELIRNTLEKKFPNYGILTEEDADNKERLNKNFVFIVDPLDGTKDFVERDDMFAVNIALVKDHKPVVGVVAIPCRHEIYFAVKGCGSYMYSKDGMIKELRISNKAENITVFNSVFHKNQKFLDIISKKEKKVGKIEYVGSALKACLIAQGKGEVCYSIGSGTKEWDTCAPQIVLEEAGGIFVTTHKKEITYNREDVYNRDGFLAMNRLESDVLTTEELEDIINEKN